MGRQNEIGAVQTTLRILESLFERESAGVTEISRLTDLPKSTVYTHLNTLENEGYLRSKNGEYQPSLRFLELGETTRRKSPLFNIAKPELDELAEETGELVNVAVEEDFEAVYLYLAYGTNAVRLDTHPGKRVPLYCTAIGKCLLAHMDERRRETYLDQLSPDPVTKQTITETDTLRDRLESVRERGYAIDRGERMGDIRCVAAPIIIDDDCIGAISLTSVISRLRGTRLNETIPNKINDTASVIRVNLTFS
ncbi:MAG: IclR family transcriptional regulator [Halobacteriales archaeon]